jgi:hypothetical protein
MRINRWTELTRFLSLRTTRRLALAGSGAAALTGITRTGTAAQYDETGTQVGLGDPGGNGFEFVGVIQQVGLDFTLAGYITNLAGIDSSLLFGNGGRLEHTEGTARLAITGTAAVTARSILQNLFVLTVEGAVQFSLIEPGASFEQPGSFSGDTVTSCAVAIQNVINVQAPQAGIATGFGTLEIESTDPFTLSGQEMVIGEPGLRYRISLTGQGQLGNPETPEATILVAGNGVVAR